MPTPRRQREDAGAEPAREETPAPERASGGGDERATRPVRPRREQYLITQQPRELLPQGVEPLDLSLLEQSLRDDEEIEFKRTIAPLGVLSALSANTPGAQTVLVAQMAPERADNLNQLEQLVVEQDALLDLGQPAVEAGTVRVPDPGVLAPAGEELNPTIVVQGEDGTPVAGANVYVFGRLFPYQGTTGPDGRVTLTLFNEQPSTLKALYVKPKADHWSTYVERPELRDDEDNVVVLPPLSASLEGFPDRQTLGWGQEAMRLGDLPAGHRGAGVKVAVIDSGSAADHRDLQGVSRGFDVAGQSADTWNQDAIGHGSHCAGVILGRDNDRGVRGFAPDAEFFVYKIFPGGRFSDLLDALDRCISDQVDVANLSLGTAERSEIVEQKLALAKKMGVACVVAAGNDAGPVRFPANSPEVLAVAAVGKRGSVPAESYHATQVAKGVKETEDGFFSAKFTCFGPEIDVAAPGVGIVSSVPDDNYAAWDGTSMAAPHVAGLAALVLAHHPDFQGRFRLRSADRVDRLFTILRESCRPLDFGDRGRSGAGLPDAVRAFEVPTAAATRPAATTAPAAAPTPAGVAGTNGRPHEPQVPSWLDGLRSLMEASGLLPGTGGTTRPLADEPVVAPVAGPGMSVAQLTALVEAAGLAGGGTAARPEAAAAAAAPDPLRPLSELMSEAGLVLAGSQGTR